MLLSYTNELSARDAAIAERNMELETAEKEARDLRLAIREEKRQIDLRRKEVLQEKWLEGEIATLQIEVGENRHTQTFAGAQIRFNVCPHGIIALISIGFCSQRRKSVKRTQTSGLNPAEQIVTE